MISAFDALPSDPAAVRALLVAERAARQEAEAAAAHAQAEAANAVADRASNEALIAHLKLEIEKLRCQTCLACGLVHMVRPQTGQLMSEKFQPREDR
ncbi:MAG: hypothetical protein GEV13_13535 [Rhodospirillales bacterium]|nr:hypothetical protein [Rhodospirillales bacterium]